MADQHDDPARDDIAARRLDPDEQATAGRDDHSGLAARDERGDPRQARGEHEARGLDRDGATLHERQRERFGGFHLGPALFGWLVALGISVILAAILSAAGAAIGLTSVDGDTDVSGNQAKTVGIVGGALLVIVFLIAYYAGGYVAGRMARFDGARQGVGVWIIGIVVIVVLGVAGAILGSEYNVLSDLDLPSIPLSGRTLTTGGAVAGIVILLGSLLAAILGGKAGERFHRRIDRAGV